MLAFLSVSACNVPTKTFAEIVYSDISLNTNTDYTLHKLLHSILILRYLLFYFIYLQKAMTEQVGSSNNASDLFERYLGWDTHYPKVF
jgi:hypothetical protein